MDKRSELALRRKYQLYAESSDAETNNNHSNTLRAKNYLEVGNRGYQDSSLPAARKINLPDSVKLHDLNATKHRRTSSDSSKDKTAGAYVHVKGKRKAPPPPMIPRTLSPKSSLGRKKRPAPPPPIQRDVEEATSSTSLLEDKEIKALIEGASRTLSQNLSASSTSSISSDMERRSYVSPYLKIREDRKLTDEQKRVLIDQVSNSHRRREEKTPPVESAKDMKSTTPDMFTIERGQLVYQGNESPKLPPKEEKLVAPPSPLSPRPWFKRQMNSYQKESTLKSSEKRKNKSEEKDLPECGYSRNSFFGSASRFNIFARIGEDSKRKERDTEKRKSQIGMPNISELDREAAEIIQMSHEMNKSSKKLNPSELLILRSQINNLKDLANDDDGRQRSAKDLINKFEADTSHVNRITLNPAFVARKEFFGDKYSFETRNKEESSKIVTADEKQDAITRKSKLPLLIKETNGIRKQNDLMGLWTCPYCTLENPNWKIICGACEKIKPYEKRFCANGELIKSKENSTTSQKYNSSEKENAWKTELMLKYFNPPSSNALSKSASETAIAKSLKRKSPSPSRIAGSPQMNTRRHLFKASSEQQESKIDMIEEETVEKEDKKIQKVEDSVLVKTTPTLYAALDESKLDVNKNLKATPDLNEIRSARLAKFNLITSQKKKKSNDDYSNAINSNRKQSPEKKFPDKLDFSDPVALEQEKERLREKIRAMNAKALAEKYPVLKKIPEGKPNDQSKVNEDSPPVSSPAEASKLGAIRKVFKTPFEARRESFDKERSDEKILNHDKEEKPDKVSISVQTKIDVNKSLRKKDESFVPTTISEITKTPEIFPTKRELTTKQQEEVEEISDQLKSKDGIETFKATLRSKSINQTNTLAINKILRLLENAIADGKYDDAAQLAIDLAKMKVSLSVTRQKERPKSDNEFNFLGMR